MKSLEHWDIVQQLNQQDQAAFKVVWDEYYPHAFLKARTYVKDEEVAKDIVQEAFMKLWVHRSFNNESHIIGFLMMCIRNLSLSYLDALPREGKLKAGLAVVTDTVDDPTDDTKSRADLYKEIEEHVALLPEKYQRYYDLARKGLSHEEISKELSITYRTAENYPVLFRNKLRKIFLKYRNIPILISLTTYWVGGI